MPAMFQLSSLAVAAAAVRGDPGGCSFAYSASLTYAAGDAVSMTSGASTYNYVCVSGANSAYCNQAAFAPGGQHSGTAWRKESAPCAGVASTPAVSWTGNSASAGCPADFNPAATYAEHDTVAVGGNDPNVKDVYRCSSWPMSQFCSLSGYKPGASQHWSQAWGSVGQCAIAGALPAPPPPTYVPPAVTPPVVPAPVPVVYYPPFVPSTPGCPASWIQGGPYGPGSQVSKDNVVYQCKTGPVSGHCPQAGYEPGITIGGRVTYWPIAWNQVGDCGVAAVPAPVPAPVVPAPVVPAPVVPVPVIPVPVVPAPVVPAPVVPVPVVPIPTPPTLAPAPYGGTCFYTKGGVQTPAETWDGSTPYEENDVVRIGRQKYKCKWSSLVNMACRLLMYKPTQDPNGSWQVSWTLDGLCPATGTPTSPPTTPPTTGTGAPTVSHVPSAGPSTSPPTKAPTTITGAPTVSHAPSDEPSSDPSDVPSEVPQTAPSEEPSDSPSYKPTAE